MAAWASVRRRGRWNHNIAYHRLILAAVPPRCQQALDVGCGEGMLARQLARLVPHVTGIDRDAASIQLARRQDPDGTVGLVCGDFLTHPFAPMAARARISAFSRPDSPAVIPAVAQAGQLGQLVRLMPRRQRP